ncbi:MAG: hypothetical protein UY20_C0005G0006 [Candidatus Yanofskybacteria bacterium GW2011_GWA1_48_10]|uniref:Uncharacterized protein n=1 Tax=Candidatus Yanofskybacteria bacterium GW2011_GWA1_48_10 TaxID=1619022 RepID=A0A0G1U6S4_9BACT|nr:MAG: hypothetical protein UY20_C0005G0006 [Candidatus Yanofskybacteria bacterium GW2011_GWA1_48_10]
MNAEYYYRQFVFTPLAEDAGGERYQTDKHEKEGVDICKHRVQVFSVNGNEKMMRPPVGKEHGKGEDIAREHRQELFQFIPQSHVVRRPPDAGHRKFEDQDSHNYGKNAVGKLVQSRVMHDNSIL